VDRRGKGYNHGKLWGALNVIKESLSFSQRNILKMGMFG
jgi:hypothetical protein